MKAVLLENVSKVFPDKNKAIDNITISIEPGEVFGFLGPNGAENYHCEDTQWYASTIRRGVPGIRYRSYGKS